MSKHTPGPWKVYDSAMPQFFVTVEDKDICKVSTADGSLLEAEANANLIAAAPDLLEALELLTLAAEYGSHVGSDAIRKSTSAIAKAKGETK